VLEEYRTLSSFAGKAEFFKYCEPYSVFSADELEYLWNSRKYQHVIRFTYNIALNKRPNRKVLIETLKISEKEYFGFLPLTSRHIKAMAQMGGVNESLIVD
jgi:hypothetical protein